MRKFTAAVMMAGALSLVGGAVGANEGCPDSPARCEVEVKSTSLTPSPPAPAGPSVVPAPAVAQQAQLPVTGGDAAMLAVIGGALILGGGVLVRSRRLVAVEAD